MWGYYCHCVGKLVAIKAQQKMREQDQARVNIKLLLYFDRAD